MDALFDEWVLLIYPACDAMDAEGPSSSDDMTTEMSDDETRMLSERIAGRGAERKKPADVATGKAVLLALIKHAVMSL